MYAGHSIAVVVPAYNEAGFVGDVIRTVPGFVDRIYAIDDCSTDGTWVEIQRTADQENERAMRDTDGLADGGTASKVSTTGDGTATDTADVPDGSDATDTASNRVVPIRHDRNQGVGAAIKTGYARAKDDDMDIAAVMAGDGQMDPDRLHQFLDPIVEGRADYAKGNRLLDWDFLDGMSRFRLFGNILLTLLTKIASGYWRIADPQNGYTAIRLDVFDDLPMEDCYDEYGFANDILVRLNAHGKRVADVPMPASYGDEESSIDYRTFITSVSLLLLRDFLWRINVTYLVRDFHPLALCYYAGATAGGLAILSAGAGLVLGGTAGIGALLASVVLTCFAVTGLLAAMVLDRQHNASLELQATG